METNEMRKEKSYTCWLDYKISQQEISQVKWNYGDIIYIQKDLLTDKVVHTAIEELQIFFKECLKIDLGIVNEEPLVPYFTMILDSSYGLEEESYLIQSQQGKLAVVASDSNGILYGVFKLIECLRTNKPINELNILESPSNKMRMIDHWDNVDGSIERGYAGKSIFYKDNRLTNDLSRIKDYARLLASIGINSLSINNVNVHNIETKFITDEYLEQIAKFADAFSAYGIKTFLSINFAAPMELGGLATADPLDEEVKEWWKEAAQKIYHYIPDFGGFLVKADSENRPGPFTYNRTHAEGANMLAEALEAYDGLVIWRCFVYNCHVDWRDRKSDRAKAAYDNFIHLDGEFNENVILQIKNGPMDFQIREPLSPLFGALKATNTMMEFQITQEYTGQQKHICFLVPMWKECLDFDTYAKGKGTYIRDIVSGKTYKNAEGGIAAVSNIGDSICWTGNPMAAANLYGFGRLCWNPQLKSEEIAEEWITLTLGSDSEVHSSVQKILLDSRKAYEDYTAPLGIGWMVSVMSHYGPSVEGYEYSQWGTYHYADYKGIGVDRTCETGTGYAGQYFEPNKSMYENVETCPEELLLFFHHVNYDYVLKDGRALLQYIYDVHFAGVEKVEEFIRLWETLNGRVEEKFYQQVKDGLKVQLHDAMEWRDVVNTYFYRRTGITDNKNRKIYK